MDKNEIINLEKTLNHFIGRNVIVIQGGFLQSQYSILKFKYFIEYDVLNILSEENENFIKINLNQIYQLEKNEKNIKFYLDNDTTICLTI